MAKIQEDQKGRWFAYGVTAALGIAFSMTLLSITWENALDRNIKEFALESYALREAVSRNVRSAHNVNNSFSAFFGANPGFTDEQFYRFSRTLLDEHEFIESAVYCIPTEDAVSQKTVDDCKIVNRDEFLPVATEDLFDGKYAEIIKTARANRDILTLARRGDEAFGKKYWMFKSLHHQDTGPGSGQMILHAALVDTVKLFDTTAAKNTLSLTMFSNASNLSARETLYSKTVKNPDESWTVASMEEEGMTQFPAYSIRLGVSKELGWSEVDKELVFNALLIGVGITLLIIALVRAKDEQSRELKERNIVIERQVKEQTRELAETRDQALEASRVKSEFLASMSHEIRTPLNAIIGMSSLLEETPLNSEQKNYINVFRKAGDTLLSLVNDILDLSKIEAKQLVLEEIDFDLLETVEESVEIYALKAAGNGIELLSHIDTGVQNMRVGDPARLRQIILNLISNALKFTEKGEVVVRVEKDETDDSGDLLRFSVRDTGIGIPREKLEAIFASFTQVDSSTTRKYGGTGLGLTISKSLSEMMGGKIWVESVEGEGSTFLFTAKLAASEKARDESSRVDLDGTDIMVLDDNQASREILSTTLKAHGAVIQEQGRCESALEILTSEGSDTPSVVLLDYRMPDMDGFAFIEAMKKTGARQKIFLMLGAADLNQHIDHIKNAGISGYIVKPVKRTDLLTQLESTRESVASTDKAPGPSAAESDDLAPLKILLVEDNPDNRLLIKAYLKKMPWELDEAENGQVAVDKFQSSDYDIVLMDVQMPVMDGHEATRSIRAWENDNGQDQTPIISLTAHAFKEEIDRCLEAGCNTHLSKPVKKATLISTIQEFTEKSLA